VKFVLEFGMPDAKSRENLWRKLLPLKTPTTGLDFSLLAHKFDRFNGANVRNSIMRGAEKAALRMSENTTDGRVVTQKDLLDSCDEEQRQIMRKRQHKYDTMYR